MKVRNLFEAIDWLSGAGAPPLRHGVGRDMVTLLRNDRFAGMFEDVMVEESLTPYQWQEWCKKAGLPNDEVLRVWDQALLFLEREQEVARLSAELKKWRDAKRWCLHIQSLLDLAASSGALDCAPGRLEDVRGVMDGLDCTVDEGLARAEYKERMEEVPSAS